MYNTMSADHQDTVELLNSVEGETSFFRAIIRSRPVGIHRHFHMIAIQSSMFKDTGRLVPLEEIWKKLRSCYDVDALEAIDLEAEGYELLGAHPSAAAIRSPSPSANLSGHPFFREEFSLPYDEAFESLISQRRMRASASIASSSPTPSPVSDVKSRGGDRKRSRTNLSMAGLVGGDSDSSALTQESGDEGMVGTPRGSVITGTDGGTDNAEDEDVTMREFSRAPSASPKPTRGRSKPAKKGLAGRGRGGAASGSRPHKKRKRGA